MVRVGQKQNIFYVLNEQYIICYVINYPIFNYCPMSFQAMIFQVFPWNGFALAVLERMNGDKPVDPNTACSVVVDTNWWWSVIM